VAAPEDLPRFARPPVIEVAGTVQFVPLPGFALREIVQVAESLPDYELRELGGLLAPLRELEPGGADRIEGSAAVAPDAPLAQTYALTRPPEYAQGSEPPQQRGVYSTWDGRYVAQIQHDRIAVSERSAPDVDGERPCSPNVWRELEEISAQVRDALVGDGAEHGPDHATLLELTHVNEIRPAEGVWQSHGELHRVLRALAPTTGNPPWARAELTTLAFAFPLHDADGAFAGRLHVSAKPTYTAAGSPTFTLELTARRLLDGSEPLSETFAACRHDAVRAFTALTTSPMHLQWGRER
jgi:hypothetical protein